MLCKATHCMSLFLGPEDQDFVILLIGVIRAPSRRCDYLHMLTVHILPRCGNVTLFSSLLACCTHHVGVVTALLKAGMVRSGSGISSCFCLVSLLVDLNSLPCTQAQTWMQWTCVGWLHYTLHCPDWGSLGAVRVKIPQRAFHSQERKKLLR